MKKLSIFALSYLFAQMAYSDGVASTEDALKTPTLGASSAYSLATAEASSDFVITKYLEANGSYTGIDYALSVDDYEWEEDSYGNLYLNFTGTVNNTYDPSLYTGAVSQSFSGYTHSYAFTYNTMTLVGGGAVVNSADKITSITGDFTYNYVTDKNVTIVDSNNSSLDSVDNLYGGAIVNASDLASITGSFIGNYVAGYNGSTSAMAGGGAILNAAAEITSITGDFIGNYAAQYATGGWAGGGAIINTYSAEITSIEGDFIGNYATVISDKDTQIKVFGGAINNSEGAYIGSITGDFIENYAAAVGSFSRAWGGAIGNDDDATIDSIAGDFIGNYVTGSTRAYGGAISSEGTINKITGNFIANYVKGVDCDSDADIYGGAIYNEQGSIAYIEASFIGNYASATTGTGSEISVVGGAVYNGVDSSSNTADTSISFFADTTDIEFTGNYVELNGAQTSNAIYNTAIEALHSSNYYYSEDNYSAIINFNASSDYSISVNDGISGISDGVLNQILNINALTDYAGTVYFNNLVENQTINVYGGTLVLGEFAGAFYEDFYGDGENLSVLSSQAELSNVILTVNSGAVLDTNPSYLGSTSTVSNYGTINLLSASNDFTNPTILLENSISSYSGSTLNIYTKVAINAGVSLDMSSGSTLNVYGTTSGMLNVEADTILNVYLTSTNISASAILDSLYGNSLDSVTIYIDFGDDLTVDLISGTTTYIYDDLYGINSVSIEWADGASDSDLYDYVSLEGYTLVFETIEGGETPSTDTATFEISSSANDLYALAEGEYSKLTVSVAEDAVVDGDVYLVYGDAKVDDVELNLSQGTFNGDIRVVGAYSSSGTVIGGTVGNVVVNITGGTFYDDIYAGADSNYGYLYTDAYGNNIYGEYSEGTVTGDVTVNISGNDVVFVKSYEYSYGYQDANGDYQDGWADDSASLEEVEALYAAYEKAIANNGDYEDGYFYYEIEGITISGDEQTEGKNTLNISAYNTTKSEESYFKIEHFDEINITEGSYAYLGFDDDIEEDLTINIEGSSTLKSDDVLYIDGEDDGVAVEINVEKGSSLEIAYVNVDVGYNDTASLTVNGDLSTNFLGIWTDDNNLSSATNSFIKINGDLTMSASDIDLGISNEGPALIYLNGNNLSITTEDIELSIEDSTIYFDNDENQNSYFICDSINAISVDNINWADSITDSTWDEENCIMLYTYDFKYYENGSSFEADDIEINIKDTTLDTRDTDGSLLDINTVKVVGTGSSSSIDSLEINITDSTIYGDLYAAGSATEGATSTIGSIDINIDGGSFYGDLYAGATDDNTTVTGDITVTIGGAVSFVQDAAVLYIDEENSANNEYTITIYAGETEGASTLNVLDTFTNADYETDGTDDETLFDANIVGFDSVSFNVDAGEVEVDPDTDLDYNKDIVDTQTLNGGDSSVSIDENSTITADVAFSFSADSTEGTTSFSGNMSFEGEGEKVAIELYSDITSLAGTISATYTSDDDDLVLIKTYSGSITFDGAVSLSATITDSEGNESNGIAISNDHDSTEGLSVIISAILTVKGDIVANSPFTLTGSGITEGEGTVDGLFDFTGSVMYLSGNITTSDSDLTTSDDISISKAGLYITDGTISTGGGDLTVSEGALVAKDTYIDLGTGTLVLEDSSSFVLAGGSLTADSVSNTDSVFTVTTGSSGSMGDLNIANVANIEIEGSASMLVNETITISTTQDYTGSSFSEKYIEIDNISYTAGYGTSLKVTSLSYFEDALASTSNEKALAIALDSIEATKNDELNEDIKFLKQEVANNGLDAYIMSSNSYIAEVNTMLLSNLNIANVNRARAILEKPKSSYVATSNSDANKVEYLQNAEEIRTYEREYNNVAQLQSINLLGSKASSNGVAGYDYWSVGALASIDEVFSENLIAGVSIGGVYSKVEGDAGDNANSTAFLINAYAVFTPCESVEVFANIGYAHFWNDGSKGTASADWDSDAFNFLIGTSYAIDTGVEGLKLSPLAMLNLVLLNSGEASYSNYVNVDSESYLSAKLMLGLEAEYAISANLNSIFRVMYSHEFGDESYDMTYSDSFGYMGGINYTGGEAGSDSALLGFGLSYDFSENCTGFFDYNAYIYESLITHSLNLSVGINF